MNRYAYREQDNAFGRIMLSLRKALGLSQADLAQHLHISRRAVVGWETGSSYPKAAHFKGFIELCVTQHVFPPGYEAQEIRILWKEAHQKGFMDEQWLSTLLDQPHPQPALQHSPPAKEARPLEQPVAQSVPESRMDWGEALEVPTFYGREQEISQMERWIVEERCRVVSILGIGGIGKSALAVSLMHQVAKSFKVVLFRSLRNAPSCEALIDDCLQTFSPQFLSVVPDNLKQRISLLIDHLRKIRTLIILDNLETLLEEGDIKGRFRPGFEGYEELLGQIAQTGLQSCLLLTSREKPAVLRVSEGKQSPVRSLRLTGLPITACEQLFIDKGVVGTPQDQTHLAEIYAGNPLALKIVTETIVDIFGGEISLFLAQETAVFGSITQLLSEQVVRLSTLEQAVLYWLAIAREPMTLEELRMLLVKELSQAQLLEAADGLRRRSLVERGQRLGSFTLQSVVLEYVTADLIARASEEIQQGRLEHLIHYGLSQAQAREYVRQAQVRLIVIPLLEHLQSIYTKQASLKKALLSLLNQLRKQAEYAQGYGPANLLVLLYFERGDLCGIDLSHLSIRGVNLQGIKMQDAKLSWARLQGCIFTQTFDVVTAVAINSNGQYWAVASKRGEVWVWKEAGQTLHRIWQAHTDLVWTLAFSPDGNRLASGSWDSTVKLWDVTRGTLLWSGRHTNNINGVAFAPDGSMLATCGQDAVVHLWNMQSKIPLQTLSHPGPVFEVAWSPDGHLLASGSFDGCVRVWEIQQTQAATCVQTLAGHSNWVMGLAIAPDGNRLASGSWDGTVKLWDVASEQLCQTITGHRERVNRVAWSSDGRLLASASRDQTVGLWDVEESNYRAVLQGHTAEIYSIAFTPDSSNLLSGCDDGTLRLWDVAHGQCVRLMHGYAVSLFDIDWSPDGTQLVSGGTDTQVTIWDVTGEKPARQLCEQGGIVFGVGWSPDGRWLASSSWDNAIYLWDATSGTRAQELRDFDNPDTPFFGIAWSPNGQRLASGTNLHGVQVWEVNTQCCAWSRQEHPNWIRRVAWSPDGTRLASGDDDGSVCMWDAADGTLQLQLPGHQGAVTNVLWHPDGTQLVSAGSSREGLFVWDVQRGERILVIEEHTSIINAMAWGTDEEQLVSGGSDGILRWWDIHSGECVRVSQAHHGTVQALKRSPDGRLLATCGDDGAIMLWDLHSGEYLRTLRRDRPYERLDITGIKGLTEAQKVTLRDLGAIEQAE